MAERSGPGGGAGGGGTGTTAGGGGGGGTGYAFFAQPDLITPATINAATVIPVAGAGYEWTLLDAQEIAGPIVAGVPFLTEWGGSLELQVSANCRAELCLHTDHTIGSKSFRHTSRIIKDMPQGQRQTIALNEFDTASRVRTGRTALPDGSNVDLVRADLSTPAQITYKFELVAFARGGDTRQAANIIYAAWHSPFTYSYQIGAVGVQDRIERIRFRALAANTNNTSAEAQPAAADAITVENGSGPAQFLSGIAGNDFTIAAGVYLAQIQGEGTSSASTTQNSSAEFTLRRADDNTDIQSLGNTAPSSSGAFEFGGTALLRLDADTAVNIQATWRRIGIDANWYLELIRIGKGDRGDPGVDSSEAPSGRGRQITPLASRSNLAIGTAQDTSFNFSWHGDAGEPADAYDELFVFVDDGNTHLWLRLANPDDIANAVALPLQGPVGAFTTASLTANAGARGVTLDFRAAGSVISGATISIHGVTYRGTPGRDGTGDGSGDDSSEALQTQIDTLKEVASDLHVGPASSGWAAANAAQGGLAVRSGGAFSQAQAMAAAYGLNPASPGGKFMAARVLLATNPAQARVRLDGTHGNTYRIALTSMHPLGADATWKYYGENLDLGDQVTRLTLELTGSAAHVGASKFAGELTGTLADDIVQPVDLDADTPEKQRAFRARIAALGTNPVVRQNINLLSNAAAGQAPPSRAFELVAVFQRVIAAMPTASPPVPQKTLEWTVKVPVDRLSAIPSHATNLTLFMADSFNPGTSGGDVDNDCSLVVTKTAGNNYAFRGSGAKQTLVALWWNRWAIA